MCEFAHHQCKRQRGLAKGLLSIGKKKKKEDSREKSSGG
jgi:hypothetical protein